MPSAFCVVYVTTPKGTAARRIAREILKSRLAACVNIVPSVESHYWWEGKIQRGGESLLIIKTRRSLLPRLEAAITAIHPYGTPEVISLPILRGNKPYLSWLHKETGR